MTKPSEVLKIEHRKIQRQLLHMLSDSFTTWADKKEVALVMDIVRRDFNERHTEAVNHFDPLPGAAEATAPTTKESK